jgi:phage tail tape-measure protein
MPGFEPFTTERLLRDELTAAIAGGDVTVTTAGAAAAAITGAATIAANAVTMVVVGSGDDVGRTLTIPLTAVASVEGAS